MPSHGAGARQRNQEKRKQLQLELQSKRKAERESTLSYNLTPEAAFAIITKRIGWVHDKIAWHKANGRTAHFLEREIEAMYWMMDKVSELSKKLLEKQEEIESLKEGLLCMAKFHSKEYTDNE